MQPERAREFIGVNHRAVLATNRSDGRPQLSPVTVGVGADGRVLISTRETAIKTKNLARDPRVSLCVMNDRFYGDWIQAEAVGCQALEERVHVLVVRPDPARTEPHAQEQAGDPVGL